MTVEIGRELGVEQVPLDAFERFQDFPEYRRNPNP